MACEPSGACPVACVHEFQLLLCQHVLDVLSSSAAWMESEGEVLSGSSSLRQDREAKNSMRGKRAQKIINIVFFVHRFVRNFDVGFHFLQVKVLSESRIFFVLCISFLGDEWMMIL